MDIAAKHAGADDALFRAILPRLAALRSLVDSRIPARFRSVISADDVLQDVWIAVSRAAASFAPDDPEAADRWLRAVAISKTVSAIRTVRARKRGGEAQFAQRRRFSSMGDLFNQIQSGQRSPSREVRAAEAAHAVAIAIQQLPSDRRRAIELRFLDGLPQAEIAERLERSTSAVNSLLFNALRQLRTLLGSAEKYLSGAATRRTDPSR